MASQALASLTATYTDSEGEENPGEKIDDEFLTTGDFSRLIHEDSGPPPRVKHKTSLVSYHDDTIASDDDEAHDRIVTEEVVTMETEEVLADEKNEQYGVQLPPEPTGKCPQELQDKINRLHEKMVKGNLDMNKVIQERKDFRNPSIYEKLIQFCGINELGTNYPLDIYDPFRFGKESYYEELAKIQKQEMDKREKERKEKSKVEFVTGSAKRLEEEESKKRKSKWDQPAPHQSSAASNIKPAGLIQPALTKIPTGTKGTVISAFGTLPKKTKQ